MTVRTHFVGLLIACVSAGACRTAPGNTESGPLVEAKRRYAADYGSCVATDVNAFAAAADELSAAVSAHLDMGDSATKGAAQAAFAKVFRVWQRLELAQVGPLAASSQPFGGDFRDNLYVWPNFSRCFVEQNIVSQSYAHAQLSTLLATARDLAALEYLLFFEGSDNACSPSAQINSTGSWAALTTTERNARRRAYASAVAGEVRERAHALATAWTGFRTQLQSIGQPTGAIATSQSALNLITDGLFYFELTTKMLKLAKPLGLSDCAQTSCPDAVESPYGGLSMEAIRSNVAALTDYLHGCGSAAPSGLSAVLDAANASALRGRLDTALEEAVAAAKSIPDEDIRLTLANNRPALERLYEKLRVVAVLLKSEIVTTLDLELPRRVESDND